MWREAAVSPHQRVPKGSYEFAVRGACIASSAELQPAEVFAGWMDSKDDRADILSDRYEDVGVGVGVGVKGERADERDGAGQRLVDAMIKAGKAKIEEASLNAQTQIMTIGFSEEAKTVLDAMPTPEQLMPPLQLAELEKMLDSSPGHRHLSDY